MRSEAESIAVEDVHGQGSFVAHEGGGGVPPFEGIGDGDLVRFVECGGDGVVKGDIGEEGGERGERSEDPRGGGHFCELDWG